MSKRRFLIILLLLAAGAGLALASGPGGRAIESARLLGALGASTTAADIGPQEAAALRRTI
jgi:hypothetical protein